MKTAILQVADTGPLESLVLMLKAAGYNCLLPDRGLRDTLRKLGCDTVVEIDDLVKTWGYEEPMDLRRVGVEAMDWVDLYVDVKAHRNGPKVWRCWKRLENRTLWYRINGSKPENVPGKGDELNPPCPVLTPNIWYREAGPWGNKAYACWPPFHRWGDYFDKRKRAPDNHTPPFCLVHNLRGWGYGPLVNEMRKLGVKMYGFESPDGLVKHHDVPNLMYSSLCMVHLKSSDAPGYALYEALAGACPVVCTRRLIWRNHMEELFDPFQTCYLFDRETHDGLSEEDVRQCAAEVAHALECLKDPVENQRIGMAGHERLKGLMWSERKPDDVRSLKEFMGRHFP